MIPFEKGKKINLSSIGVERDLMTAMTLSEFIDFNFGEERKSSDNFIINQSKNFLNQSTFR
jgi:hypothetical protein